MNLVFCKFCKFFRVFDWEECRSPKNITSEKNYYQSYLKYEDLPKDINKDNNCIGYEPNLLTRVLEFLRRIEKK